MHQYNAGPFPVTEDRNKYIMVVSDYFSKWPETYAIPNQEATTVAKMLIHNNCVSGFGVPVEIYADQGRNFKSNLLQRLTENTDYAVAPAGTWNGRTVVTIFKSKRAR